MKIPIAKTRLTEEEFKIIKKPLKSGWLVQGKFVEEFEKRFSKLTGAKHSIAVTSCTTALHLSLSALNFKIDDEAILCHIQHIMYVGFYVILAFCRCSWNISFLPS